MRLSAAVRKYASSGRAHGLTARPVGTKDIILFTPLASGVLTIHGERPSRRFQQYFDTKMLQNAPKISPSHHHLGLAARFKWVVRRSQSIFARGQSNISKHTRHQKVRHHKRRRTWALPGGEPGLTAGGPTGCLYNEQRCNATYARCVQVRCIAMQHPLFLSPLIRFAPIISIWIALAGPLGRGHCSTVCLLWPLSKAPGAG
eukprot:gene8822-biopygen9202